MKNEVKNPKMGRPKKTIDEKQFDTIIQLPIIKEDVARILNVSESHLERYIRARFHTTFETLRRQNAGSFKKNLLGKQYELAMKGNVTLLIWLGKQYLEQSDKVDNTHALKDPYQNMTDEQLIAENARLSGLLESREVKQIERAAKQIETNDDQSDSIEARIASTRVPEVS